MRRTVRGWITAGLITGLCGMTAAAAAEAGGALTPGAPDGGLAARTDSVFATWNRPDSPGCVLGVVRDGRLAYAHACGAANLELGVPLTSQSVCDLGSVSKQFTAFCVQLLIHDRELKLTDDVRKYLPELPDYAAGPGGGLITIDHLLHHTSGLRDYNDLLVLAGHDEADHTTKAQALDIQCRQKALNFRPGERFLYSNTNYFLLSVIVERVSGMSMRDFAAGRVFGPLGMTRTQFNDAYDRIVFGRASGYAPADSGFANAMSDWEQTGDGAVLSSVDDLLPWVNNFETAAVGGREVIEAMEKPGRLNNGEPVSYASGLDTAPWRGLRCIRHNGAWAGYRAEIVRFPEQRTALILVSNLATMNTTALCDQVAELWLAEPLAVERARQNPGDDPTFGIETLPAAPVMPADLARYVGRYRAEEAGLVEVTLADSLLTAGGPALRPTPLRPLGQGRFLRMGARMTSCLVFEEGSPAKSFQVLVRGRDTKGLRFMRIEPWNPTLKEFETLAGSYWSDELRMDMEIDIENGTPRIRYGELPWSPLEVLTTDTLTSGLGILRFQRDTGGLVVGLTLSTSSAQGITFARTTGGRPR